MGKLINRIPGLCLLISSLPGKALRTLVDIARLAERFNMRSQNIKRHSPSFLYIKSSLSFETVFKWLLYFQSVDNNPL